MCICAVYVSVCIRMSASTVNRGVPIIDTADILAGDMLIFTVLVIGTDR